MTYELTVLFQPEQREALYRSVATMPRVTMDRTKQPAPETRNERAQRFAFAADAEPPAARCSSAVWDFPTKEECQAAVESLAYAGGDLLFAFVCKETQRGEIGACFSSGVRSSPWDFELSAFLCHVQIVDAQPDAATGKIMDVMHCRINILRRWAREQEA